MAFRRNYIIRGISPANILTGVWRYVGEMIMERESYFDNIRFGLIILVVLGHAFINHVYISEYVPSFLVFVYSFHMPLFLFVGGYFIPIIVSGKEY